MKEKNVFWKRLRSIKNMTAVLTVAFGLIGVPVSFWLERPLEGISVMLVFLGADALLARLDLLSDIEDNIKYTSSIVTDIKQAVEKTEMEVIVKDNQIPSMVEEIAERVKATEVLVLSSGLTTRQEMIANLVQKGVRVRALIQDPETALDKMDKTRILTALNWIQTHTNNSKLFEPRFHYNISTVRAIIINEADSNTKYIFLSWYFYEDKNSTVRGDINPTIYCTTESKQGDKIYSWLTKVLDKDLRESRKAVYTNTKKKRT